MKVLAATCSVIIPCYNYGRYLPEALESVLAQTRLPEEIIVIDDGSKDNTRDVAMSYAARGVTYCYQPNAGLSAARNTGIRYATGKYIACLDADDAFHPRKLELQLAALENNSSLGALGTREISWPGSFQVIAIECSSVDSTLEVVPLPVLACSQQFIASSMVLRRAAIEDWLPEVFDTALRGAEDWDCWLRIAEHHIVANVNLPLTGFRDQVTGLGTQPQIMGPALERVLEKATERELWSRPGLRRLHNRAYAHIHASTAIMHAAHGQQWAALQKLAQSWKGYLGKIGIPRTKLAIVALLRLLKLKPSHQQAIKRK